MPKAEEKYDKTIEAMDKILDILREYDLMGSIALISEERGHFHHFVETSWSCLDINKETGLVRMKALARDFKTKKEHERIVTLTVSAVHILRDLGLNQAANFEVLCEALEQKFQIEHEAIKDFRSR